MPVRPIQRRLLCGSHCSVCMGLGYHPTQILAKLYCKAAELMLSMWCYLKWFTSQAALCYSADDS